MKKLEDDAGYDAANWYQAMERAQIWGEEIPIGRFFQRTDLPSLHAAEPVLAEGGPLAHRDVRVSAGIAEGFVKEFM